MALKFLVVSTGYNCQQFVKRCYESVLRQTYSEWQAVFLDDGSKDKTQQELLNLKNSDNKVRIFLCDNNNGAAYRRWQILNELTKVDSQTVIVLLGMDDYLKPNALETIAKEYHAGKLVTYGSWIDQQGRGLPKGFILDFPEHIHERRDYRKVGYRSTAPNTFKKLLFNQLTEEDFKIDGHWVKATTESNLMFSCLEMAGKNRIGIITEPIYIYQRDRKDNARKRFGNHYQDQIYSHVINLPKKELLP